MTKFKIGDYISELTCSPRYSEVWKIVGLNTDSKKYWGICVRDKKKISQYIDDEPWFIQMGIANKKFYKLNESQKLAIVL